MIPHATHSRFRFIRQLGLGGTAEVALVLDSELGRQTALKYPRSEGTDFQRPFSELARREFQLIGNYRFPGLVRLLEAPPESAEYLLMELCRGPSLDQLGRVDDVDIVLNIISSVAIDLEFLNATGIVHGDVKPHNIFLPEDYHDLTPSSLFYSKLSDFSLGRRQGEADDQRLGMGTVGYMAPETIISNKTNHQSDLFALGIIAYQLLTGKHPFMNQDSEPVRVNSRIREEDPTGLDQLRPDIPLQALELFHSLLSKNEADRPNTALAVCQQLRTAGAKYPFDKALRPAHFIRNDRSYDDNLSATISLDERERNRIDLLCDNNSQALRMILTANFIRGNMIYDNGRFHFCGEIYWPVGFRRRLLTSFLQLPHSMRKSAITTAVIGSPDLAQKLGAVDSGLSAEIAPALPTLLLPMLRTATVKRLSAKYSVAADNAKLPLKAVELFVQAGILEEAERCAHQSAIEQSREHHGAKAIAVLKKVIRLAETRGTPFVTRNLLMLQGDIQKDNGETDDAFATYNALIELYRGKQEDNLLAETYKDIGDICRLRQDRAAGMEALEHSLSIYRKLGDELEISHVLNNMGNLLWHTAELSPALERFRQALRIQRRLKATAEVASTMNNIGIVYGMLGRLSRCISVLNLSLKLKKEIGHAGEIARTLNNLGYAYHTTGEMGKAVECLSESLEINRRIGSKKEILFNLENLTSVMVTAGQLKQSIGYLHEGTDLASVLNDQTHVGLFNWKMATVLRRLGRLGNARECLDRVEQSCRGMDHKLLEVNLSVQRAALRLACGDRKEAFKLSCMALVEAEATKDTEAKLNALLLIVKLSDDQEQVTQTGLLIDDLHLKREKELLMFSQLEFLLEKGDTDRARDLALTLKEIPLNKTEEIELAWMCNLIAESLLDGGDQNSVEPYIRKGLGTARKCGLIPELMVGLMLQGRLHFAKEAWEECYAAYKKALQFCQKISKSLDNDKDRRYYQQQRTVQFLVREIKRLGSMLGSSLQSKKKGQTM